jgi:Flp pilus assembly protein TadG
MARNRSRRRGHAIRRGAALTELAICLPILSIVTLGAIEAANGIYVRQKLVSVAYDLARSASAQGDQSAAIHARANALLKTYGIKNGKCTFSPAGLATVKAGMPVSVTVTAPMSKNSVGLTRLYGKIQSSASVTMTKG